MKLKLKNFQCYRDKELTLKPLTFLTGPSNSGKSAIIRGVGFLTGDLNVGANRLVTRGEKQMSVTLEFDSNVYERRLTKDGIECQYNGIIYPRMGTNVPDEFKRLATIQFQFDPPFLITDTPTDVFKKISQYIKMDTVLKIQELVQEDIKLYNRSYQVVSQKIEEIKRKLEMLKPYVEKANLLMLLTEIKRRITLIKGWHLLRLLNRTRMVEIRLRMKRLEILHTLRRYIDVLTLLSHMIILTKRVKYERLLLVLKLRMLRKCRVYNEVLNTLNRKKVMLLLQITVLSYLSQYYRLQIRRFHNTTEILTKMKQIGICPVCKRKL